MGVLQIPEESELANSNRHQAYIELNTHELSQTVALLKSAVQFMKLNPTGTHLPQTLQSQHPSPRFDAHDLKQRIALNNASNSFQSISIPKSIPILSPVGRPKYLSTSSSSQDSIPSSSSAHCSPVQNLPSATTASHSTNEKFSEIQGAVGSDDIHVRTKVEQLSVREKIRPGLGESRNTAEEEKEASLQAGAESRDQGEARLGVIGLVRMPEESSAWRKRFTTPMTKHNKNNITAMCYLPSFVEFKGSDDNSGWLISSSKKHLNLWQCTSRSSVSERSLQVISSQRTEFVIEDMIVDMRAKSLCAFCPHPQDKALCITMHTLGGPALFKYQGMIHIPCEDAFLRTKQSLYGAKMLHLTSLGPVEGALGNHVAGAFDRNVSIYDLLFVSTNPSTIVPPKEVWQAHDSPISCMHYNPSLSALITGAADGCIRLWDLKAKPVKPVRQFLNKKQITCIEMLDETTMCSSSLDGTIQLQDLCYSASPVMSVIPDKKSILNMSSLQMHNTIAFTTGGGLFCLQFASKKSKDDDAAKRHPSSRSTTCTSAESLLWPLTPLPSTGPCTGIKWNSRTCTEIYTSQPDGSIAVFAK